MSAIRTHSLKSLFAVLLAAGMFANHAFGELALRVEDINANPGVLNDTNVFDDTGFADWDENGVFQGNDILVATMVGGPDFAGIGITAGISNGENGFDVDGNGEVDVPNIEPVHPAIVNQNTGAGTSNTGKLSNGNIIRASVWMRSDPNDPAVGVGSPGAASMPQVEGLLKIEMWKEALSGNGDFDPNDGPDPAFGDRIWDQDQQGGEGSNADINGDGFAGGFGQPVAATLSTEAWTQLVVEYVVDDFPIDLPNGNAAPWCIGGDCFTVDDVEEVRAVFFAGDFTGSTNFAGGGSWWMDNYAIEVFTDQAAADSVDPAVANPAPVEVASDFDGDGDVDGADFLGIQQFDPGSIAAWQSAYPQPAPLSGITAVPEPTALLIATCGIVCLLGTKRR